MPFERIIFRVHAIVRMFERHISETDVRDVIRRGDVIEQYDSDYPFPSKLYFGIQGTRLLHVVAADDPDERCTIVVTVYEPDPDRGELGYRRRRIK